VLVIVSLGLVLAAVFYLFGLHAWAWVGVGFIPFAFVCWGLSWLLAGSRNREIYANLTADERERLTQMARAYGLRMVARGLPVVGLPMLVAYSVGLVLLGPRGMFDYLLGNQAQVLAAALVLLLVGLCILFPAMIKQRRAMMAFFRQTEYARRKGYSHSDR
jgi:hypothetical protein